MTTVTIYCVNSGSPIQDLGIYDVVSSKMHKVGYCASNDVKTVSGLDVRDAGILIAEIDIYDGDDQAYSGLRVTHGGNVDVSTGRVSDP